MRRFVAVFTRVCYWPLSWITYSIVVRVLMFTRYSVLYLRRIYWLRRVCWSKATHISSKLTKFHNIKQRYEASRVLKSTDIKPNTMTSTCVLSAYCPATIDNRAVYGNNRYHDTRLCRLTGDSILHLYLDLMLFMSVIQLDSWCR